MGADLVHRLSDGEGREVLFKEKCIDNVVLRLGEHLKDFPDDFLLGKVSNIESIYILNKHTHPRIHLLYTLIIIHFELIELHLEQLIFFLTDLLVAHIDFFELHPHLMGGFQRKDPIKQFLI
jgi:hypothetical protein